MGRFWVLGFRMGVRVPDHASRITHYGCQVLGLRC